MFMDLLINQFLAMNDNFLEKQERKFRHFIIKTQILQIAMISTDAVCATGSFFLETYFLLVLQIRKEALTNFT